MPKTYLTDIVSVPDMEAEITAGYINRRFHPEFPELATVGYSDKAQFDRHWTDTVKALRGVIYNIHTTEVLARPFAKFFNYGDDTHVEQFSPDTLIMGAWDKADGSLGIQYTRPDGKQAIATRGSFESDQAIHATELLNNDPRYRKFLNTEANEIGTFLWEVVYKNNRIVLNYGERDDLILIGFTYLNDGHYQPPYQNTVDNLPFVQQFPVRTLGDVLAMPPRENAEGVVFWLDDQTPVKLKQEDYIALHRIVSSLNKKEIWRQLSAGTYDEFVVALPDEFHQWARETADELMVQYDYIVEKAAIDFGNLRGFTSDRAAFAAEAKKYGPEARYLFLLLDGREIDSAIWRSLEPKGANGELS